jgi:hypothetical protein
MESLQKCDGADLSLCGLDVRGHHLSLVYCQLLQPRQGRLKVPHPLGEVVAVQVARRLADPGEEVLRDGYAAVV